MTTSIPCLSVTSTIPQPWQPPPKAMMALYSQQKSNIKKSLLLADREYDFSPEMGVDSQVVQNDFVLNEKIIHATQSRYKKMFPDDKKMLSLKNWDKILI